MTKNVLTFFRYDSGFMIMILKADFLVNFIDKTVRLLMKKI